MTEFLKAQMEVYFIENPFDAQKIAEQVLINKRSRESAEKARLNIKKKLTGTMDLANRVQKVRRLPQQGPGEAGALHRGGRFGHGRRQAQPGR